MCIRDSSWEQYLVDMGALGYESFIRIATPVIDPILGEVFQ